MGVQDAWCPEADHLLGRCFFFIFGSSAHFGTEEYGRFVEIWILASDGAEFLYNVTDCISLDHRSVAINNQVMCAK